MSAETLVNFSELHQENERLLSLVAQHEFSLIERETLIKNQADMIAHLRHQIDLFRLAQFGKKTEKGTLPDETSPQQAFEFDEAEASPEGLVIEETPQTETVTYTRNKKGTGRKPLPRSLPYIEKIHDLSEAEKLCPCGCALTCIGEERSEQLDIVPQMTFRVVHIRKKYACKNCEDTIQLTKLPEQPLPKSMAAPGLLAAVIDSKFNRHMPLYRQESMFLDAGVPITRGTLSNWMIKSADLLTPLVKLMEAKIQEYDVAYADETPLQVLVEKDKASSSKSTMWLFIGGKPEERSFVYQYHPTRWQQVAFNFFEDFKGYLHADCYDAYVNLDKLERIKHVACMAHARRYFVNILKLSKKEGLASKVVALIAELYKVEDKLKRDKAGPEIVLARRKKESEPILKRLKKLLEEHWPKIFPKSPLHQAVSYMLGHWDALNRYLKDGRLEIDNNRSERSIKPFVIGRKNWLFHGNDVGAKAGSILFSLIETCKEHQVDVFSWFKYVLSNIHQAHTVEQLEELLPYHVDPALLKSMRTIPELRVPE
jgi:transposase